MQLSRRGLIAAAGLGIASQIPGPGTPAMASQGTIAPTPTPTATSGRRSKPEPLRNAHGALGANFNQNLDAVDYRELRSANVSWVRGFYPMPATDEGDPADHFAIRTIVEAGERGYQTILSLKFPYRDATLPRPDSPELAAELERLDQVLPNVMGKVDIITIGNEPFIESPLDERDERLNRFYEAVARHVIHHRAEHCDPECGTSLYMGAMNRLDLEDWRTPATERWMEFVRETPEIDGVDLHPHMPNAAAVRDFLDYTLPRMREDQTFLMTEFSLVWYWKEHLTDQISDDFANRYGFEPGTLGWQVIQAAIESPFSERQWNDFLTTSPWFAEQSSFLVDMMEILRGTGRLAVATYGFKQDELMVSDWGPEKTPWLLNSVFARYTVQLRDNGTSGPGYWLEDFRQLQNHQP